MTALPTPAEVAEARAYFRQYPEAVDAVLFGTGGFTDSDRVRMDRLVRYALACGERAALADGGAGDTTRGSGAAPAEQPRDDRRRAGAREDTANAAVFEDWSQSTIPPPILGVEGVEHGEPRIPLVMVGDDLGNDEGRAARFLTPGQARDLAALLDTRADVLDPSGAAQ